MTLFGVLLPIYTFKRIESIPRKLFYFYLYTHFFVAFSPFCWFRGYSLWSCPSCSRLILSPRKICLFCAG